MIARHATGAITAALGLLAAAAPAPSQQLPVVTMETSFGAIVIELDTVRAPVTVANFLRYVDAALYDGGRFYRTVTMANQPDDTVRIEVIQGGIDPARAGRAFAPIPLERTSVTGLRHENGTVSMARAGPDTGTSEFFICVGNQPALDFGGHRNLDGQGFAAFGRVIRGMDVVRQIHGQPADGQRLVEPVAIVRARRSR